MVFMKFLGTIGFVLTVIISCLGQGQFTISGYVKDAVTGETLVGANIYHHSNPSLGTASNNYGFFSLSLPSGDYKLVCSYLGYADRYLELSLDQNIELNLELSQGLEMDEVVVSAQQADHNVTSTEMGQVDIPIEKIKGLPALFGEVDILKTLQLLPGVISSGEGSAGFYVRGGGVDQNLILLDEAPVYNSGHMLGFFSVFNSDALKNTTLIKGDMPARYGGRLSSVVDIQMKEGNDKKYSLEGGIGLISSRITLQGPVVRDKSSFIISGRRTYVMDLIQPLIKNTDFAGTNYYFYDLNAKVNYRFSQRDRLYLSAYFGRDVLNYNSDENAFSLRMPYGNGTATMRWNHLLNDKLFMNLSLIYNDYDFSFGGEQELFQFKLFSGVRDWNLKYDVEYYPNYRHAIKFGANSIHHKFVPNVVEGTNGEVDFNSDFDAKYGLEYALYAEDEIKVGDAFTTNIGLRISWFNQIGPYNSLLTKVEYNSFEKVTGFSGLEPRIGLRWKINQRSSLKAAFTVSNQYIHLVSNSASTLPTDVWVPSSEYVKPQRGKQYAVGYFRNFLEDRFESSLEVYYRDMRDQIDYRDSYVNNVSTQVEENFVFGIGRAYGAEFLVRKNSGILNGWLGYTLSRSKRKFVEIDDGAWYPTSNDRIHDLSIVLNYQKSKKWKFGAVFVYGTGRPYTSVKSVYLIDQQLATEYGSRNSSRLEAYHRLDLSATWIPKAHRERTFTSSWAFSVYNMYNRKNTFFTYLDFDTNFEQGTATAKAYKVSLFPIIPSITWNFKWK